MSITKKLVVSAALIILLVLISTSPSPAGASTKAAATTLAISAGYEHSCALESDGSVLCWGDNAYGELGNGTVSPTQTPATALLPSKAIQVAAGESHSCALLVTHTVACWGDNEFAELGQKASFQPVPSPRLVPGLTRVASVVAGDGDTCALMLNKTLRCWGEGALGELGNGTTTLAQATPVAVYGLSNVRQVALGYHHACALTAKAQVLCWGLGDLGQLGSGFMYGWSTYPRAVPGLSSVASIYAGGDQSCALLTTGVPHCWGYNSYGQLGDGSTTTRYYPDSVVGLSGVLSMSMGESFTCATLASRSLDCWGYSGDGQLSSDEKTQMNPQAVTSPIPAAWTSDVSAVATGSDHTCILRVPGGVRCWGNNSVGQLGNPNPTPLFPVEPVGL